MRKFYRRGSCHRTTQPCSLHPSPSGTLPLHAAGLPVDATRDGSTSSVVNLVPTKRRTVLAYAHT